MIKRTGVRKMACVSFLVIFCVCFLVTGTARAAEPNTVSRGEWIQRLVSTFQMTVEDHTTMPDNYFSDLSSEDTYYSDILTAVEFGVIDLEAGEPFQPDSPATREFAAQTLNFCLGFQIDEETYTYIDSNETAYPEDAQVAINRGWFVLVNGAFCPDQPITPSEMQGMLADAQSVLTSDATGEIQSDFTVAEGVIVIPETAQVSVDMEDTLTIVGYEGTIHTGDVFVVTFGGFPVAYQAGNVQEENGTLVIQGLTGEATENAISEAHISGTSEADLGNFEPAEETTYYITDQNKGANAPVETLRIAPRGIEYDKGAKTLTIIEDVKLNQATAGSLTVVMSNIETDHDVDGTHAFEDCTNLKDVHLPKNLATLSSYLFRGCSAMQVIELPPTLEEIEDAAFENSGMVSIEIPGNCATLGNDVFADCVSLKEAVLEPGVKSIGNNCFDGCTALETVSLPEGLTTIRDFAFRNCDALTAVEVPDSVTTLETYAFSSCDSLSDVSLGTGITEIPQYAFYGCPSLQKVTIPYRVTEISGYAFANCTGLTEITIPQSVTTIASTAFSYPDKLTIYGVAGSYAETYANDHSIKFVSRTVPATSVSLNTEELTINRGSTAQLVVNVQPEDFTDSVSWKSANTAVATVTDAGVVKAVSVGSTTIRVVVGNISVDCVVTVVQPVTSISLNRTSLTLEAASSFQLVATANPSTAQNREVTWSSSDTSIASVNENGLVTAHKKGTATITAKAVGSNVSRSCTVTVPNNAHVASSVTELESPHPYEDSCSDVWVYTVKDATYLEFTFHESTDIESGFDYLYLYNAAGEEVGRYTGKALAGQTIRIEGNTVKIKLVSDASGSAWGFQVTGLDTDGTVNPYESLLAQMEQLSELTDIDAILSGVKELEQNELTEAMEDQENGTAVLDALTELERATQIETAITVTDEMNTTFKEGDIQVLGAALNIAEVNQGQTNTVTLVVDSAGSDHALSDQYKNGLAFSMHLDNASASLSVPVQIKLPVPSSLESDNLVLFHYKADGSTETVDFTLSQENGQAYATFVLTEFSDFQFANLDYILGDVTGDGRVNGLDVNRLFRYVNGQISLNPQQLASADVTGDSRVNGLDVNRLFRYVNGQITEL